MWHENGFIFVDPTNIVQFFAILNLAATDDDGEDDDVIMHTELLG